MKAGKRVALIAGICVGVGAVVVVGFCAYVLSVATGSANDARAMLRTHAEAARPAVLADQQALASHWLLAGRPGGGDASTVLNARAGWRDTTPGIAGDSGVPQALDDQLKAWGGDWHKHVDDAELSGIDVAWISGLAGFDHWDLEAEGSPFNKTPWSHITAPLPDFSTLQGAAKARLLQGLRLGDALAAVADVRELARLCASTEILIGEMVGVGMIITLERAREAATTRGVDVSSWPAAMSDGDVKQLQRALWGAGAYFQLQEADPDMEAKIVVGRCAGMAEGISSAVFLRPMLNARYADRYVRLGAALQGAPCRLKNLRRVWAASGEGELPLTGELLCHASEVGGDGSGGVCDIPDAVFEVPFVKEAVGEMLLGIASPNWLQRYLPEPAKR